MYPNIKKSFLSYSIRQVRFGTVSATAILVAALQIPALGQSRSAEQARDPLSIEAAFNFIDHQVVPIKSGYRFGNTCFAKNSTHFEVDEQHGFAKIRGYLYTNALAAIALTHRGVTEGNSAHLAKAEGILKLYNEFQYTLDSPHPHLAGAFPNQLIAEDYHANPGAIKPYMSGVGMQMVRHGNNAWYLTALSYYTLQTGDRQFVPVIERLADYLTGPLAQDLDPQSPKYGAILFGWGNAAPQQPLTKPKTFVATEHQTEAFAGLLIV